MPTVIADAGPLHYLILIRRADVLRGLFGSVWVPDVVLNELRHQNTPSEVAAVGRGWPCLAG